MYNLFCVLYVYIGLKADPSVPSVISCSADGSVRIWHLENMSEVSQGDQQQLVSLSLHLHLERSYVTH